MKAIPKGVQDRLSNISSNKEIFDKAKIPYENALNKAGHNVKLEYKPTINKEKTKKSNNRKRVVTWFNPPWNMQCMGNIGVVFAKILEKSTDNNNILKQVLNRNCVKLSYCTMPNMASKVGRHNNKVEMERKEELKPTQNVTAQKENVNGGRLFNRGSNLYGGAS